MNISMVKKWQRALAAKAKMTALSAAAWRQQHRR